MNDSLEAVDLVIVLRYRKAVTYGFHALLGALEEHQSAGEDALRALEAPIASGVLSAAVTPLRQISAKAEACEVEVKDLVQRGRKDERMPKSDDVEIPWRTRKPAKVASVGA